MKEVSLEAVKNLRQLTGAGIMECKKSLSETNGDVAVATALLRKRGFAIAEKKADSATRQGVVEAYIHRGNRLGALVEVNCETDFVARTQEFRELAHNLAMQVAATSPKFIAPGDITEGDEGNPNECCLLLQPFIKEPQKTVQDIIAETVAKVKENIRVRRFARFELGS